MDDITFYKPDKRNREHEIREKIHNHNIGTSYTYVYTCVQNKWKQLFVWLMDTRK